MEMGFSTARLIRETHLLPCQMTWLQPPKLSPNLTRWRERTDSHIVLWSLPHAMAHIASHHEHKIEKKNQSEILDMKSS